MVPSRVTRTNCEICNKYNASIASQTAFAILRKGVLVYMKMLKLGGIYINKNVETERDQGEGNKGLGFGAMVNWSISESGIRNEVVVNKKFPLIKGGCRGATERFHKTREVEQIMGN